MMEQIQVIRNLSGQVTEVRVGVSHTTEAVADEVYDLLRGLQRVRRTEALKSEASTAAFEASYWRDLLQEADRADVISSAQFHDAHPAWQAKKPK